MKALNPKKLLTILVLLLALAFISSPAAADVIITAEYICPNEIVINYDTAGEAVLPRAFSLNIQSDDANIIAVGNVNPDYYIHPGTISIDLSGPQPVIDYGTPVAPQSDLPSGTLSGLGTRSITIEMASLYAPTGPTSPNKPDANGVLLSLYFDGTGCLTFTGNVARTGSSGVVLEDPDLYPTVTVPAPNSVCITATTCRPPCWDSPTHCHCDINNDGIANTTDFFCLKDAWFTCYPDPRYNPCCDFNCDGCINTTDFFECKDNWFQIIPPDCPGDCTWPP